MTMIQHLHIPCQHLQSILSTNALLTLLVPSLTSSPELSTASLCIAHALQLFHALNAQIARVIKTAHGVLMEGNLVDIGCAKALPVRRWLERAGGPWAHTDRAWHFSSVRFKGPSSGVATLLLSAVLTSALMSPIP